MRKFLAIVITIVALSLGVTSRVSAEATAPAATAAKAGVININTADASQFALLPRIGPKAGERIVEYRKSNGPFKQVTDLMEVKGVGQKTFDLLNAYLTIDGKTTLTTKQRGPKRASSSKSRPTSSPTAQ